MSAPQLLDSVYSVYGILGILGLFMGFASFVATIATAVFTYSSYQTLKRMQIRLDIEAARIAERQQQAAPKADDRRYMPIR